MTSPKPPPLRAGDRLLYGVGQIAEGVKNESLSLFLLFYYREVLGLSGTLTGLALLISLLSDAITDPLVGAISDRTRSRWGRRHPYLYASGVPVAAFYYAVFVPPSGMSDGALFTWLVTMLVMTRFAMTLFHVPHMALGAELSPDYRERTVTVTTRMVFSRVGAGIAPTLGLLVFMAPTASTRTTASSIPPHTRPSPRPLRCCCSCRSTSAPSARASGSPTCRRLRRVWAAR